MPTIPVMLTSEEEAALSAQAKAQGVSVDSLLRKAIVQIICGYSRTESQGSSITAEEFEKGFDEIAEMIPADALLSDEALSRQSIYTREDEWND
jgi:hypothetical protein